MPTPPSVRFGFLGLVGAAVIEPMRLRRRGRAGEQAMMRLGDHLLEDIGLARSDIHAAIDGLIDLNSTGRTSGEIGAILHRAEHLPLGETRR